MPEGTMKMLLIIAILLLVSLPTMSQVHGTFESENLISKTGTITPQINIYLRENISGPISWTGWALISKGWSEAYIGLAYAPINEVEFSLSYGLESVDPSSRLGWSLWIGKYDFSLLSVFEQGGSGYWFRHIAKYTDGPVSYGFFWNRFSGYGPYVETTVLKKFTLWISYTSNEKFCVGCKLLF